MKHKSIHEIQEKYDLELPKIVKTIKKQKAKKILLQFPDGLKPYADIIADEIENKLKKEEKKVEIMIWFGSCYGACDIPLEVERLGIDLIIQFGHSKWGYNDTEEI